MSQSAKYDISVYRGDTPTWKMKLTHVSDSGVRVPVDLSKGQTINGQVRYNTESTDVLYKLPITIIDAPKGLFSFTIDKNVSENLLPAGSSLSDTAVYDIQLSMGKSVLTFLAGGFTITRDVTRGV